MNKMYNYYSAFYLKWNTLSECEKSNYVFGYGGTSPIEYVNNGYAFFKDFSPISTLDETIAFAKNVIAGKLEFAYHDKDEYEIKMGADAHFIINKFNNGKLY